MSLEDSLPESSLKSSIKQQYVLGVDIGTTSVKAVLVNALTGARGGKSCSQICDVSVNNPCTEEAHPKSDLQDAFKIWATIRSCLQGLDAKTMSNVVRVAICGQMHGIIFWKKEEASLVEAGTYSSLHTWQDRRCSSEFIDTLDKPDSNLRVAKGYGCATTLWYQKHYAEYLSQYNRAGTIQDFMVCSITGNKDVKTSTHLAASWGYFNVETKQWNEEILKRQGFPLNLLPEVVELGSVVGSLQEELHGIKKGTPVAVAMGDFQCALKASLTSEFRREAILSINTSAQMAFLAEEGFKPPGVGSDGVEYFPYSDNRFAAVAAALNGGNCLSRFVDNLQLWTAEVGKASTKEEIWKKIVELEKVGSGLESSELMVVTPLLYNERHIPEATAAVTNITLRNMRLPAMIEAICLGIVENILTMMPIELLDENGITSVLASGACIEKHPMLQKAIFDKFGERGCQLVPEGHSCVGAALFVIDKMLEDIS